MTGVIGGTVMAGGVFAGLALADAYVFAAVLAAIGMLGAAGFLARLWARSRARFPRGRHVRAATVRPRWTDADREWLDGTGAVLPRARGRRR